MPKFGRDWTVRVEALPDFVMARSSLLPEFVLLFTGALSLLLAVLMHGLVQQRQHLSQQRAEIAEVRKHSVAMNDELTHRVKNTLAVVQSIANRTLSDGRSIGEGRELLADRLGALARTHSLILDNSWRGVALGEVARTELAPLGTRALAAGSEILLSPQVAQALALVFHELSVDGVQRGVQEIDVRWRVSEAGDAAVVDWTEQTTSAGGPAAFLVLQIAKYGFASDPVIKIDAKRHRLTLRVPLDAT